MAKAIFNGNPELRKTVRNSNIRNIVEERIDDKGRLWVRLSRGKKIGIIVAIGLEKVGYSYCNIMDDFDYEVGLKIARNRAMNGFSGPVPVKLRKDYEKMVERSKRYFK